MLWNRFGRLHCLGEGLRRGKQKKEKEKNQALGRFFFDAADKGWERKPPTGGKKNFERAKNERKFKSV